MRDKKREAVIALAGTKDNIPHATSRIEGRARGDYKAPAETDRESGVSRRAAGFKTANNKRFLRLMRPQMHITICLLLVVAGALSACQRHEPARVRAEGKTPATPPALEAAGREDSDADGLPDRAELRSYNDRENFRRWFTALAEQQFYRVSGEWNAAQRDCAGLVRFAWRESLRRHDRAWFQRMGEGYDAPAPDVRAYTLERGPLGEENFPHRLRWFSGDGLERRKILRVCRRAHAQGLQRGVHQPRPARGARR